ncbi:hypothetical protein [Planococcus sp. NCCP-2050]|uniref:hypothetical protein n=1 Tax=Planococcus sp. NCCP-2050 TaxID=2944679 RepID=UPI00203D7D19|nr:hypothetical protein [Planococcus sp. NCCP-2050]
MKALLRGARFSKNEYWQRPGDNHSSRISYALPITESNLPCTSKQADVGVP